MPSGLRALRERLAQFGLTLHPDKTRLIEFGRHAAAGAGAGGLGKPETVRLPGLQCAAGTHGKEFNMN